MITEYPSRHPGRTAAALAGFVALAAGTTGVLWRDGAFGPKKTAPAVRAVVAKPSTREQRVDALRQRADEQARAAARGRVAEVEEFFRAAKARAPAFVKEATSLDAGWLLVQSRLGIEDDKKHAEFLRAAFEKSLFAPADLEKALGAAADGFKADLRRIDDRFLVDLRADLAGDPTAPPALAGSLRSDDEFRVAYRAAAEKVLPLLVEDLAGSAATEVASLYLGNLAAKGLVRAGQQMIGVGGGFWGQALAGAVTLAAGAAVDYVLKFVLEQLGYSPTDRIAAAVTNSLDGLRDRVVAGTPASADKFRAIARSYRAAATEAGRAKCREEFDALAASGGLGLAEQFELLCEAQAALRRRVTESVLSAAK